MQSISAVLWPPLLGAVSIAALGGYLPKRWAGIWASVLILVSFAFGVGEVGHLASLAPSARAWSETLFPFVTGFGPAVTWHLFLDPLSGVWLLVITGVGFLIHVYSIGYMGEDPGEARYFAFLNFFIFAMLLLVLAGNLVVLLIGWALVGLASYFLIGFWYERPSAVAAAKKAFVMNTLGDVGILLGLVLLYLRYHTVSYPGLFAAFSHAPVGSPFFEWTAFLLYVGAMAKSAQFPLHMWLADAMEGPTPVSALIHAATMVTAGVYLMVRIYPLLHLAPAIQGLIGDIGAFTAIFAASIAFYQQDIKKVLAYSTLSQLGYMFLGVGVGALAAGVFHFLTHAFFKALLFLAAGSVIHALGGEQDLGRMGGLGRKLPWTMASFLVGCLAIAGIPPFSGYFSKEAILGQAFNQGHWILWAVGVLTAGMTAFYMFRTFFLTFTGPVRDAHLHAHAHEAPGVMTVPVVLLAVLAILGGALAGPLDRWLGPSFAAWPGASGAGLQEGPLYTTVLTVGLAVIGAVVAWRLYGVRHLEAKAGIDRAPGRWMLAAWGMDTAWSWAVVEPLKATGEYLRAVVEPAVLGAVGRLGQGVLGWAEDLRPLESGYVRRYGLSILVGVGALLAYYLIRV